MAFIGMFTIFSTTAQNNVGVGTATPDPSAKLDVESTTQGFLPPRMTNGERNAIASPAQGLIIYCTNCGANGEPEYFDGTAWVNLGGVTTQGGPPILTTTIVSSISGVKGTSGGNITSDEGNAVTARGVCWSTSPNPTTLDSKAEDLGGNTGNTIGSFTSGITGLNPETQYYVRAYATNSAGTNYGNEVSFTTGVLAIGNPYGGGLVAYILGPADVGYNANVQHGLIVSLSYTYWPGVSWNSPTTNFNIVGTQTAIGTGSANTDAIISAYNNVGTFAAKVCRAYSGGGFTDWYLPSIQELSKIQDARLLLTDPSFSPLYQGGNYYHYSSSENINPAFTGQNAQGAIFGSNGSIQIYLNKNAALLVRPMRSF